MSLAILLLASLLNKRFRAALWCELEAMGKEQMEAERHSPTRSTSDLF